MSIKEVDQQNTSWSLVRLKPSVGYLKIFGSLCFRHDHEQLIRKLNDISQVMVMVGCHSKGVYKLFSPTVNKVVINRDVEFDERKGQNWLKNSRKSYAKRWKLKPHHNYFEWWWTSCTSLQKLNEWENQGELELHQLGWMTMRDFLIKQSGKMVN